MTGTTLDVLSFLLLGLFLGMRHATDADHVVAIATIVSHKRSVAGSALIGAAWGVGHTVTVMVVGGAIIVFGVVIPPRLGLSMEFAVGIMLVVLGVLTLTGMGRAVGAAHAHPCVGAGHVLALLQAYLVPPMVREFEHVADDFGSPMQWWRNRLLRIFLVFLLTTFGALAGNYVGLAKMFSTLF